MTPKRLLFFLCCISPLKRNNVSHSSLWLVGAWLIDGNGWFKGWVKIQKSKSQGMDNWETPLVQFQIKSVLCVGLNKWKLLNAVRTTFWILPCAAFQMTQHKVDTVVLSDVLGVQVTYSDVQVTLWKNTQKRLNSSLSLCGSFFLVGIELMYLGIYEIR